MAGMLTGKKMMEKMGWKAGQGLGKDGQGAQSCLVLRKTAGSAQQGRIDFMPMQQAAAVPSSAGAAPPSLYGGVGCPVAAPQSYGAYAPTGQSCGGATASQSYGGAATPAMAQQAMEEAQILDVIRQAEMRHLQQQGSEASQAAEAVDASAADGRRKRKTKWDTVENEAAFRNVSPDMIDAANAAAAQLLQMQGNQLATMESFMNGNGVRAHGDPMLSAGFGGQTPNFQAQQKKRRTRQFVVDDWRWSNGTDELRSYVECQLTPELHEVAKQVFGKESRFPARVADDTDVMVEVTAWMTVLLRPRGSGANLELAKSMVYDMLHPGGVALREAALIRPDEKAEAAVADLSSMAEVSKQFEEGVVRRKNRLLRVGIGAEAEADAEPGRSITKEIVLPTSTAVMLVQQHFDDIRVATGILPIMIDVTMMLIGPEKDVHKAEQLLEKLLATGRFPAFNDGFVAASVEAPKQPRRKVLPGEEPIEQILIKIAEGQTTQLIEKHLKVMERAAEAEKLKLTSKAVAGKRSLMVEGTKRAHERVKLMVKELAEKGESPMLSKALKSPMPPLPKRQETEVAPLVPKAAPPVESNSAKTERESMMAELVELAGSAPTAQGLGPGPAMRHLPAPRLAPGTVLPKKPSAPALTSDDLFAGLPGLESTQAATLVPEQITVVDSVHTDADAAQAELAALAVAAERELLGLPPPGITE